MKETKRIISLFKKLYEGNPWIDVNICETLSSISAEQAKVRVLENSNSIWEIVNHMINWRINVLKRIQGKVIKTPESNYFEPISDISENAWLATLQNFEDSEKRWINYLKEFKAKDFENVYPNNDLTFYEHIHGILQHDSYHLGQIRLLIKFL